MHDGSSLACVDVHSSEVIVAGRNVAEAMLLWENTHTTVYIHMYMYMYIQCIVFMM